MAANWLASPARIALAIMAACSAVPVRMAWIKGKVGLPSAKSSPTFLPRVAASPV